MTEQAHEVERWLPAAHGGSDEALGQALDACRGYLLLIAEQELDADLRAKGGASDLVQDTFLKAHHHFDRFQGTTEAELLAWLRRLLLNNLADFRSFHRAAKRRPEREVRLAPRDSSAGQGIVLATDTPSPSGAAMEREQQQKLLGVLERLPDDYRRVLVLHFQEGRSFEEIGQLLGLTGNAASKLLRRALDRARRELGELP